MDRRTFLCGLTLGASAVTLAAEARAQDAQPSAKLPQVGVPYPGSPDPPTGSRRTWAVFALQEGLRGLGYVDGQNIALVYRWAGGNLEMLPGMAADLARLKVDVLCATGPQALRASIEATRTIPIVGADLESDPVQSGYVASFARPGGNVTGVFLDQATLTGKWLQLVREIAPRTRRVAVLWDATTPPHQLHALQIAADAAVIELRVLEVRSPSDYENALKTAVKGQAQALIQLSSPLIRLASRRIAEFTVKNRLPAVSLFRYFPESGGLMSYGPDLLILQRLAPYVDKILRGAKPGDLPRRTTHQVRVGDQPQDRQGPRPHDPAVRAGAGGSGH